MRGVVFESPGRVRCRAGLPEPEIVDGRDAIVRVRKAGICGSDLHALEGREALRPGTIFGHELAGEVVEVGGDVQTIRVGDRVLSPFTTSCGNCFFCQHGLSARCIHWQLFGYDDPDRADSNTVPDHVTPSRGLPGAQAEYVRVPWADGTLLSMPESMSFEEAILLGDNFSTGWDGIQRIHKTCTGPLQLLVVIGCGVVGLSGICAAQRQPGLQIVAVDPVESRRRAAGGIATHADRLHTAANAVEAGQLVRELAGNRCGADAILEAVGRRNALRLAVDLVRDYGVISSVGVHTESSPLHPPEEYDKNLTRVAGRASVRSCLDTILQARGTGELSVPVSQLVTDPAIAMEDVQEAYQRFQSRTDGCLKMLLEP